MARKPNKKSRGKSRIVRQRIGTRRKRADATQEDGAVGRNHPRHKPDVRIDKAQRAWANRRFEEAIWYYERALARDPHNPVLLVDVARAYALRFRYADAEKLVNLAQSLYPDEAYLQQMLGRSYVQLQQFDRAIACYRRALELEPSSSERPQTLVELGKMYERLHDLEAARRCVEEALTLAPGFAQAQYTLATIERRGGEKQEAERRWRDLIESGKAPPGVVGDSWYQLAALHDAAGRFDEAYDDLVRAKKVFERASAPYLHDAATIAKVSGRTFATITADHCRRWHAAAAELKPLPGPLALLCSHPRSGTTLLEQVLDTHPGVITADELQVMPEMVYVPSSRKAVAKASVTETLDKLTADDLNTVRQCYWSTMESALRRPIGARLLVDKNPELTMLLPLVARVFPEMRIIFALRDPRDVVISCFMQRLPLNAVSVHYLTLESTARKYAATLRAWLRIREMLQNRWIEVRYEDTVGDLEGQARRVLEFLGIPWDEAVLAYHRRAQQKHIHSPTYEAVTRPVYSSSVGRWRNYAAQLEPSLKILQPFVKTFGYE